MKMMQSIGRQCYGANGDLVSFNYPRVNLPIHLTFNNTANTFTVVGCHAEALIIGLSRNGDRFQTNSCDACNSGDAAAEGPCNGVGCCQTSIPGDVSELQVLLKNQSTASYGDHVNNCAYAFVVEEAAFRLISPRNLMNVQALPVVVDWVIGNGTCEMNTATSAYACASPNSGCYEPDDGDGYRCRCHGGYRGNPYLINGCRDIDECADAALNKCLKREYCTNTEGNYTCSCPKGYSGNGRDDESCMKKQDMTLHYILIGIAFGITALLLAAILLYMELKRRSLKRIKQKNFHQNGGILLQEKLTRMGRSANMVEIFTSSDLQTATKDFHSSMILGQGGFGTVYKGLLPDNKVVAIKKAKRVDPNQTQQFINEVFVLSQVNHKNIVRLLGCCLETQVPLLVYEFISNGTLSSHIHDEVKARFFDWDTRLKIAAETAGVLSYLHSGAASTPIIHRDVKSDNILLDHNFTARVSDFGASRLVPHDLTQLSTMVQGTLGYVDPEYMKTNHLTEKSDVYSFGVVLLELITGRRAVNFNKPEEERNLANFFLNVVKQNPLSEILDVNIDPDKNMERISEVARIAKGCLNVRGEDRPMMKEVATGLEALMLAGKHSCVRNEDNVEEMECFSWNGRLLNPSANGEGTSSNVAYDAVEYDSLMWKAGR
ncbi:hypothetical protein C2S51_019597 [Perilla frutescens var. frutescens]|nr:hypothetical protein C2S51_019597 [Perilla frutescens var. frutescens]